MPAARTHINRSILYFSTVFLHCIYAQTTVYSVNDVQTNKRLYRCVYVNARITI